MYRTRRNEMEKKYKVLMGVLVIIVLALIFFLVYSLIGNQKEASSTTGNANTEQQEQTEEEQVLERAESLNPDTPSTYEIVEKSTNENNETVYTVEDVNTSEQYTYVVDENGDIYLEVYSSTANASGNEMMEGES